MMPDESTDPLERAAEAVSSLSLSVLRLTSEVKAAETLREEKIRWLQRAVSVAGIAIGVLIILAITNFTMLNQTRSAAATSASTNTLLLGCFQPHSQCSDENAKKTASVFNQIRQTQFVIAICQRSTPLPSNPTPADVDRATEKLVACVQAYYPGFKLPPRAEKP